MNVLLVRLFIYLNQLPLICPTPPPRLNTLKPAQVSKTGGHDTQGLRHTHYDPAAADPLPPLKQAVPSTWALACAASSPDELSLIFFFYNPAHCLLWATILNTHRDCAPPSTEFPSHSAVSGRALIALKQWCVHKALSPTGLWTPGKQGLKLTHLLTFPPIHKHLA